MKKYVKTGISVVIVIALIVGCYYYMTHRKTKDAEDDVKVSELDQVLSRQLDSSYPATPREVIRFYNRLIECAYKDEYDAEQFDKLVEQIRKLADDEFLESNPQDTYKSQLQKEIASFKEESIQILRTRVCNTDEVQFREIEGRKCAYVQATYFLKQKQGKNKFQTTSQDYLLRKDKDNNWRILAFHLAEADDESD